MRIDAQGVETISDSIIRSHVALLKTYAKRLGDVVENATYDAPEASLCTPFDDSMATQARDIAGRFKEVKKVFLVGIGGSDLGTRAVYDALRGYADISHSATPELCCFDTIEPQILEKAGAIINATETLEEIVFVVISKSGNTTETIGNANVLFRMLREKGGDDLARAQTIVITEGDSPLAKSARSWGIEVVPLPPKVGGRYSVFTPVGLVPLALLGFDIESFRDGAREAITQSVGEQSPLVAAVLATYLFEAHLNDARIHELFFWNPELETIGKWYRQLLAESIGKERDDGVRVGISPTIAIGSTDLHSVGQLIFGGRNDRFTTFVACQKTWESELMYSEHTPFSLPMLEKKTMKEVLSAIYTGVKNTYEMQRLPHLSIELSDINERELGAFMGLHMTMIIYLAKLFEVNPFNQPGVEMYKRETREILDNT